MKSEWNEKRHPVHHPVRFLAGIWQQRMKEKCGIAGLELIPKELGQLKSLKKALGDLTQEVIEWIVEPVNWWKFGQYVRADSGPHYAGFEASTPQVGFLLKQWPRAVKLMRTELRNSNPEADFIRKWDERQYQQWKTLLLCAYAEGVPSRLEKIENAKTVTDIQRVFIELVDDAVPKQ